MNFSDALNLIKQGKKLSRQGWNGKNMFIDLIDNGHTCKPLKLTETNCARVLDPFICMKDANGDFIPWLASQSDLLSDDWVCLD